MRPRKQEVRHYKSDEIGTRTFKIEDLAAETTSYVRPNGDAYVGTELSGCEIVVLVTRKKHDTETI